MARKPSVALVNLPPLPFHEALEAGNSYPCLAMPLGLLYLSSSIRKFCRLPDVPFLDFNLAAYNWRQQGLDAKDEQAISISIESFIDESLNTPPDMIGVSFLFSTSISFGMRVIAALKLRFPKAKVAVGGNHATNDTLNLLKDPLIDYVVRGEAEIGFAKFLNSFDGTGFTPVKGVYDRSLLDDPQLFLTVCDLPEELDDLPHPDWRQIDMHSYQSETSSRKRDFGTSIDSKMASIMTSRGCPFHCTFCASHTVHGRKMRYRSPANVLDEMRQLHEGYGINLFVPEDDLFTVNKQRILTLLGAITDLDIPDMEIQMPNALSVNTLDEDVIDALASAGMRICVLAVESGSDYVQKHIIKKRCDLERAHRVIEYARSIGLYVRLNLIYGFPGETLDQMKETADFARISKADWSANFIAMPLLGSEMYDQFTEMGHVSYENRGWEGTYADRSFDTDEISQEELKDFVYRTNLDVNFKNNQNFLTGDWQKALGAFDDVRKLHPFHVIAHYMAMQCHEKLGHDEAVADIQDTIRSLLAENPKSQDMVRKYDDLFPGLDDFQPASAMAAGAALSEMGPLPGPLSSNESAPI